MINIADRRELFIDRYMIERMEGTRLLLHHPVPRETALVFDKPWEGRFNRYVTVFQDGDRMRLYYLANKGKDYEGAAGDPPLHICYAESHDGIAWEKPELGLVDYQGNRDNNIVMPGRASFAPFRDPRPDVPPDQQYKALVSFGIDEGAGAKTLEAFASPDGLRWSKMQDEPALTLGGFDSHNVAFWSETENCFVAYYRVYSKTPDWRIFLGRRTIARATSDDFLHWSDPVMMEFGDVRTDELYTNATLPYFRAPHLYTAFPKRYVLGRNTPLTKEQIAALDIDPRHLFISEGVFMTSRGGNRYDRTFMEGFFRPGPDPANWCSRNGEAAWGILQTGPAEISLYYTQHFAQTSEYLVRATLRLDGFASVHAGYEGGEMVTPPFLFRGSALELNMATSAVGGIRVEIQDENGKPFKDYGVEDSYDLYGDDIAKTAKWHGSPDVSRLAGCPVRLRFVMKDADLYSLKFNMETES